MTASSGRHVRVNLYVRGTSFGGPFEIVGRPHYPANPRGAGVNMVTLAVPCLSR